MLMSNSARNNRRSPSVFGTEQHLCKRLSALAVPGDRPTSPNDRHRVNTNDSPIANKERARGYTRSSLR